MARPTNYREPLTGGIVLDDPPVGQSFERVPYFEEFKGMFATVQPMQADPNVAIIAKNFVVNDNGKLQIRRPLNRVLYDAAVTMAGIIGVTDPTGTGTLLLFHSGGIKWSADGGTTWTAATGPALVGAGSTTLMNYAMWDTTNLLFTCSAGNKTYTFNLSTKVYSEIAASKVAQIMTVFGGRVISSAGGTNLVEWSVKNNNADWSGTGSGNEPLRLSPGTSADDVIGLFPVNDTQMLIIRTGGVWLCETTGNVDSPFTFNFLYRVALAAARTLAYCPDGVFALGLDDVWLLKPSGPESVGRPIIGGWVNNPDIIYNQYQAVGAYEALTDTYHVYIPFTSSSNAALYLRGTDSGVASDKRITDSGEDRITDWPLTDPTLLLSFNRKRNIWTYQSFNLNFAGFSVINFRTTPIKGFAVVTTNNQAFVSYRSDQLLPNDGNDEYDYTNTMRALDAVILTGAVGQQSESEDCTLGGIEVDLTTEAVQSTSRQTLVKLYRARSGPRLVPGTAVTYSDKTSVDTGLDRILHSIRKNQTTKKFWQIELTLSKCATYILNGVYVYVNRGSQINP